MLIIVKAIIYKVATAVLDMKRFVFISALFFVFLLSVSVSAQSSACANYDDVILRLSAPTNAHGQKYDQTPAYSTGICYSTIFGQTAPTNPSRTCSGTGNGNRVVRLSSANNAHGEIPDTSSSTPYTTEVCYQGLTCRSVGGNAACATGEQEVLQLSGATNAHLETASGLAYTSASNYKICCSNAPTTNIANSRWLHYDGTPFGPGEYACVNQWVRAASDVTGASNVYVDFGEADCITGNPPCSGDDPFVLDLPTPVGAGGINLPFQITTDMISSSSSGEINPEREFYFITKNTPGLPPVNPFSISPILNVWPETSQCIYGPPTAVITAPVHQGIYFANTNINFVSGCSSPYEPLNYNWEIVQNGQPLNLGLSQTLGNFQYNFVNTGQALVRLTCTGQTSGLSATAEAQILVVASPFVFTYINKPTFNEIVHNPAPLSGPYYPRQVQFSASDSFAVDTNIPSTCNVNSLCGPTSSTPCTVTCLSGNCPTPTQNSPNVCIGTNNQPGGPLDVIGTPASNIMNFDWTFSDSNWNNLWNGPNEEGVGVNSGFVTYDDLSDNINDKHMSVTASITSGSTTASATFDRDFTLGRCLNDGNTFLSLNGQQQATTGTSAVPNACRGVEAGSSLDDCCPTNLVCEDPSAAPGSLPGTAGENRVCVIPAVIYCSDLVISNCGNWQNLNPQAPYNQITTPISSCSYLECYWNNNQCEVHEVAYAPGSNGACNPNGCVNSDCAWSTTQTNCENGQKTISYTGTPITSGVLLCTGQTNSCMRPSVTVPCGSLNFELGFFNYIQFIASAIVIALIYVMLGIRRNNNE